MTTLTSPNLTVVPLGSPALLIDRVGNRWGLTLAGVITCNGAADDTTAHVVQIALVAGVIWQQNATPLWWQNSALKVGAWTPPAGVATSPILPYISADEQ